MARTNVSTGGALAWMTEKTHEGAPARTITAEQTLRRSVLACLLWESGFYEDGQSIADRIAALVPTVAPEKVAALAIEARTQMHIRHTPLFLVREMVRHASHRPYVRATLAAVIQRADELAEFLAIYWGGGDRRTSKDKLPKSVQKGLADAFGKFSAYQLAKYNRDAPVKLRDVLLLCHASPNTRQPGGLIGGEEVGAVSRPAPATKHRGETRRHVEGQGAVWKQLIDGTLEAPDTWEVAITAAGKDESKKRAEWTRLLTERKLGGFALIRNLRNLQACKVEDALIRSALVDMKPDRILPFRFLAAVRHAPAFASELESAMFKNLADQPHFDGMTVVLVDGSASMNAPISDKSEMTRHDAGLGVAITARELSESCRIFAYSDRMVEVPAYRGLALSAAILGAVPAGGTLLGAAVSWLNKNVKYDRLIVITDEQSHDPVPGPNGRGYVINVAMHKPGVGYGPWVHVDGWSDRVLDFIREDEAPCG